MLVLFLNKLDNYWSGKLEFLRKTFPEHDFVGFDNHAAPKELLGEAQVIVKGSLSLDELRRAEKLKVIVVPWTGVDGLPLEDLKKRSIVVSNNHGNAKIVAERALALSLALTGKIVELHSELKKGVWLGRTTRKETNWFSVQGKTCSILGLGQIGLVLARFLKTFDCSVKAFKRNAKGDFPNVDTVTTNLEESIYGADLVFVTLPLTVQTENLIDKEFLKKMKGKYLINVSRGKIVAEKALYEALSDGTLAGAAIDVWYDYPSKERPAVLPSRYPIHTLPNVVLSPHVGSWSIEGLQAMVDDALKNIVSYLRTGEFVDTVDLDDAY